METEEEYLARYEKREELEAKLKAMLYNVKRREDRANVLREYKKQANIIMPSKLYIPRLREVLPLLQNPANSRANLAEMIGVKRQTIYNWIVFLRSMGFDIPKAKRGRPRIPF